jgi:hypothetical protein
VQPGDAWWPALIFVQPDLPSPSPVVFSRPSTHSHCAAAASSQT